MKKIILALSVVLVSLVAISQENKNVLLTIDGREITSEEFLRVYSKNNNITPETEKKNADEYLDLFINFKLKVIEAENLGYDTVQSFITELAGYKKQLANPYMHETVVQDKFIEEAYYRTLNEVRASHIMVRLSPNASPADTIEALNKIMSYRERIMAGESFEKIATETAVDPRDKAYEGDLGYFSAFIMVYPFENVAYNTPVGEISMPVRTQFGYHLIKVTDKRPSKGSARVSHIMTRYAPEASAPEKEAAKEKIEKALEELKAGANWDEMVQKYSENPGTKKANGEIGWLKTNKAPEFFLEECFKLEPGQFSGVIETQGGYHIVKLLEKKPVEPFDELKPELKKKIEGTSLYTSMINEITFTDLKKQYGCEVYQENALPIASLIDSSIYKKAWNASVAKNLNEPVIKVGDKNYTQYDYAKYLAKLERFSIAKKSFNQIVTDNLDAFSFICLQDYSIEKLEKENLDFKYLLKEYHDGILLFNLTNDTVWKKAQDDSVGLNTFYLTAEKHQWNPRIVTNIYEYSDSTFTDKLPALVKKQLKAKKGDEFVIAGLCQIDTIPCVSIKEKTYEKNVDSFTEKLNWKKGSYISAKDNNKYYFYYVKDILPKGPKQLNEARGLYIADYQNYLEKEWIAQLRNKYPVKLNEALYNDIKANLNTKQ